MFFKYGDKVKDTITGYVGIVTVKADYYGKRPDQYYVEGIDSTGRPMADWIEEFRLQKV